MQLSLFSASGIQTRAYRLLRERVATVLNGYSLTPTHWALLSAVANEKNGIRQIEIAEALHVKPPHITVLVRDLEAQAFIRVIPHQIDSRSKLIVVTPKGKKMISNVELALRTQLEQLVAGLSDSQLEIYFHVLKTIITNDSALQQR
jgi:DNA-binding MarR family transcriptional regulator